MMNGHGHPSVLISLLIFALIAWRLYARFRRTVGRQQLSKVRPWITVIVFPLITALLMVAAISYNTWAVLSLLGGVAVGVGLGIYGLRLTKFEVTDSGLYYTPSAHLGIALSAVLVLRILYRAFAGELFTRAGDAPPSPASSPLTLVIFGTLAGYYTTYAIGLLRWRRSVTTGVTSTTPAG